MIIFTTADLRRTSFSIVVCIRRKNADMKVRVDRSNVESKDCESRLDVFGHCLQL